MAATDSQPAPAPRPANSADAPWALAAVAASACVLLLAPLLQGWLGGVWLERLYAAAALLAPMPLAALGARRAGRLGRLAAGLAVLAAVLLVAGLALLLQRPAPGSASGLLLLLGGLWLGPLVLALAIWVLDFDRFLPSAEELDRLRRSGGRRP